MTERKNVKHSFLRLQSFLRIVPWLVLLLTLVVSSLTLYQSLQAKESVFRAWVTELSYKKRLEFKRFVEPVVTTLRIAREWGSESGLDLDKREQINRYFIPTLNNVPQIFSLIIANGRGQEYLLRRDGEGWQSRSRDPLRWPGKILRQSWQEGEFVGEDHPVESDYDPRQRPWFKGVMAAAGTQDVAWTAPYLFFSTGQTGVTAALRWPSPEADPGISGAGLDGEYIIAFDVLLCDVLDCELELGQEGRAFIVSDEGKVLGASQESDREGSEVMPAVDGLSGEGLKPALAKWQRSPEQPEQIFSFRVQGKPWWAGFTALPMGDRHLWLAVVLPEKDILEVADYPVAFFRIPLTILVVGGLLFFLSFFFVRRYLHSLEVLRREGSRLIEDELQREAALDDPAQRIYELIKAGESERLEFKSTVRWNLREDRAGKEIEIAWLKGVVGFLNTEGGVLLIGVEDDGTVAGLERDNFVNDDKCLRHIDSLVSTHIGLEFSRFIHFAIVEVGDHKIVEIRCQLSEIPAFLKKGEAEDFFIRTGPASRKLKPSQIIKYLASRKTDLAE
ncbi:MAG: putative DNA binding domain-containing protein [Pseudomonadota bacterium]|nr:putative DNA binding domain-containing protein [Pseudomonadota bacterium]